jgi:hypothetical protein
MSDDNGQVDEELDTLFQDGDKTAQEFPVNEEENEYAGNPKQIVLIFQGLDEFKDPDILESVVKSTAEFGEKSGLFCTGIAVIPMDVEDVSEYSSLWKAMTQSGY